MSDVKNQPMTTAVAGEKFRGALELLMKCVTRDAAQKQIGAELIATLSLPVNREKIIAGDKHAIAMLFTYIDGCAAQFMKLEKGES